MNQEPDVWDHEHIECAPTQDNDVSDTESVTLLDDNEWGDNDDEVLLAAANEPEPEPDPEPAPEPEPEPQNDYLTCVRCAAPYDLVEANDHNCCRDCRVQMFLNDEI